eukprot:PhM_4_TR9707/c0_g1_i1/m.18761
MYPLEPPSQPNGKKKDSLLRVIGCLILWVFVVVVTLSHFSRNAFDATSTTSPSATPLLQQTRPQPTNEEPSPPALVVSKPPQNEKNEQQSSLTFQRGGLPPVEHLLTRSASGRMLPKEMITKHCPKCVRNPSLYPDKPKPLFCSRTYAEEIISRPHLTERPFDFSWRELAEGLASPPLPGKPSIVYAAVGPRFYGPGGQSYVWYSIEQARKFNPTDAVDIYLVMSDHLATESNVTSFAERHGVMLLKESEVMTAEWEEYRRVFYIQGYMHPGGDRKKGNTNFNKAVSERFYVLQSVIEKFGLTHVLHLENDIMLYTEWKPVLEATAACTPGLASTIANVKGVIPGVVYVRDAQAIRAATSFISDLLSCNTTFGKSLQPGYANDMTYFMNFYQYFGSAALAPLPAWEHAPRENCIFEQYKQRMNGEKAIWDAASFGQWYSFTPPGGDRPPLHIRNAMKGRFLDVTPPPKMEWREDAKGRRYPVWKGYRILGLHIHAKNLWRFLS